MCITILISKLVINMIIKITCNILGSPLPFMYCLSFAYEGSYQQKSVPLLNPSVQSGLSNRRRDKLAKTKPVTFLYDKVGSFEHFPTQVKACGVGKREVQSRTKTDDTCSPFSALKVISCLR